MGIQAIGKTHVGHERARNEDAFLIDHDLGLYAIADGMGGHQGGEMAAYLTLEYIESYFRKLQPGSERVNTYEGRQRLLHHIDEAIQEAGYEVFQRGQKELGLRGMGTTLTMLLIAGNKAMMGHVGHSRLYLYREGELAQLSHDHTIITELIESGVLSEEEAQTHAFRHVLSRAVALQETTLVDTLLFEVLPGDVLLLCSDGIHRHLNDEESLLELLAESPWEELPEAMVAWGMRHKEEDDMTALVIRIPEAKEETPEEHGVIVDALVHRELQLLRSHFLGQELPMRGLLQLLYNMEWHSYEEGEALFEEGDLCDRFLLMAEGSCTTSDGQVLHRGESFGDFSLVQPHPLDTRLEAREKTSVLSLSYPQFQTLLRRKPRLGVQLMQALSKALFPYYSGDGTD